MRICLVLEGSYPYVHGGVSTWMHAYIQAMPQQEFSLWVIGAKAQDRGKFVYELPPNVKEVEEVFLDDALRLHGEQHPVLFTADERTALRELVRLGSPDWDVLYRLFQEKGVQYERFCNIPLKQEDGWVDIGAVVRLAPIKDVKTMIYAFFELASRVPNVRLHIMGGVDDEDYAKECYALVEELQLKNLIFTGRVDVVQYMQKLDFTILTSISEGQPLSVLESMAACRPCVTTEVGCCRELLEGAPGDTFGIAGYCVPPMYRQGLADAMEKMCASRARREEMGRIGQRRVDAYFHHEQMLANYRKMYDETAKEYHLE